MIDGESDVEGEINGQNCDADFVVEHLVPVESHVGHVSAKQSVNATWKCNKKKQQLTLFKKSFKN